MDKFILVFVGGGIGSFLRFALSVWVLNRIGMGFPYGTLVVNLLGCFIIGLIAGLPSGGASLSPTTRLLLITGFLGGLTTFSTYEYESFLLVTEGAFAKALLNLGLSVLLGFLSVLIGYLLTRSVGHS
jgi:CrcB protein